jgi:type I restriction enzyme M protein
MTGTGGLQRVPRDYVENFHIPLPPLDVQKEIVAEIEGYQKVIDGARAVLDNYRPHIPIHPDWPMVALGDSDLFKIESGGTPKSEVAEYWGGPIAWATLVDLPASDFVTEIRMTKRTISERGLSESSAKVVPENSIIVSTRATIGRIGINRVPLATNQGFKNVIIEDATRAIPEYVAFALTNIVPTMEAWATGGTFKELSKSKFSELEIALPPLATQQIIVAEIEAEQALVAGNHELIRRFEKKIQATLARVWGEEESAPAEE